MLSSMWETQWPAASGRRDAAGLFFRHSGAAMVPCGGVVAWQAVPPDIMAGLLVPGPARTGGLDVGFVAGDDFQDTLEAFGLRGAVQVQVEQPASRRHAGQG